MLYSTTQQSHRSSGGTFEASLRRVAARRPVVHSAWQFLAMILWLSVASTATAQTTVGTVIDARREYNVKAVSIYGFCRFTTWPPTAFQSPHSDLVVGVYGDSRTEKTLALIAKKKKVGQRKLRLVHCDSTVDIRNCHVLFISGSVSVREQTEILTSTRKFPVLVVGERPGIGAAGAVANFYISRSNVKFELNSSMAEFKGLKLDAKLLSLGTAIQNTTSGVPNSAIR